MAAEGLPDAVIQAIAGHTRSATTRDIYTHVMHVSLREARDRMDAAYARLDGGSVAVS